VARLAVAAAVLLVAAADRDRAAPPDAARERLAMSQCAYAGLHRAGGPAGRATRPGGCGATALRVEVTTAPTRVSTRLGDTFAVASTLRNVGASPLAGLVAHLNVVSLTHGVYVDPEDWSDQRTQYAAPIPPASRSW
jgi:hypothetical protein